MFACRFEVEDLAGSLALKLAGDRADGPALDGNHAGQAESAAGRTKTGLARIDWALRENEGLTGDSAPGYIRTMLATSNLIAGTSELAGGLYTEAERHFTRAAELTGTSMAQHPSDVKTRFDFSTASLGIARCLAHGGQIAAAAGQKALAAAAVLRYGINFSSSGFAYKFTPISQDEAAEWSPVWSPDVVAGWQ